jgi:maltooligosyltrehalose trehalohydrolase
VTKNPHAGLLAWHRGLIELRRRIPALSNGLLNEVFVSFDETTKWFVVRRGAVVIACNLSQTKQPVPAKIGPESRLLLASEDKVQLIEDTVELPPDSVAIVSAD